MNCNDISISALYIKKWPSYDGIYKQQHVSANKVSANNLNEIRNTQQKGWPPKGST